MESEFLNWDKIPFLTMFLLSIRLNTTVQSSDNHKSFVNLSLNSVFIHLTKSTTLLTNVADSLNTTRPPVENITKLMTLSNHREANIMQPSENLTKTLHSTTNSYKISKHRSVNKCVKKKTNITVPIFLTTNFTINNGDSIQNDTKSNHFISSSINIFGNSHLNQSNMSSSMNNTTSSTKLQINRSSMFEIWYRITAQQFVPKSLFSRLQTYNLNKYSKKSIVRKPQPAVSPVSNPIQTELLLMNEKLTTSSVISSTKLNTKLLSTGSTKIVDSDILQDQIYWFNKIKKRFKRKKTTDLSTLLQVGLSSTTTKRSSIAILSKFEKFNDSLGKNSTEVLHRVKRDVLQGNSSTRQSTLMLQPRDTTNLLNTTSINSTFKDSIDLSSNTQVNIPSRMTQIVSASPTLHIESVTNKIDTLTSNISKGVTFKQLQTQPVGFSHSPDTVLQGGTTHTMPYVIPMATTSNNFSSTSASAHIIHEQETLSLTLLPTKLTSVSLATKLNTNKPSVTLNSLSNTSVLMFSESSRTSLLPVSAKYQVSSMQTNTVKHIAAPTMTSAIFSNKGIETSSNITQSFFPINSLSTHPSNVTFAKMSNISSTIISHNLTNVTPAEKIYTTKNSFAIDSVTLASLITQSSSVPNHTTVASIHGTLAYSSQHSAMTGLLSTARNATSIRITPSSTLFSNILNESTPTLRNTTKQSFLLGSVSTKLYSSTAKTITDFLYHSSQSNNLTSYSSLKPLYSTKEYTSLNSLSTKLFNFALENVNHTISPVTSFGDHSTMPFMRDFYNTVSSFVIKSTLTAIPMAAIQTTPSTQHPITLSANATNAHATIIMTHSQQTFTANLISEKSSTARINTAARNGTLNTQTSYLIDTLPYLLNKTDNSPTTMSLTVGLTSNTTSTTAENFSTLPQSGHILLNTSSHIFNITTVSMSAKSFPTNLESTMFRAIPGSNTTHTTSSPPTISSTFSLHPGKASLTSTMPPWHSPAALSSPLGTGIVSHSTSFSLTTMPSLSSISYPSATMASIPHITSASATMVSSPSIPPSLHTLGSPFMISPSYGTAVTPALISSSLSTVMTKRLMTSSLRTMETTPFISSSVLSGSGTPPKSSSFGTMPSISSTLSPFGTATNLAAISMPLITLHSQPSISSSLATMLSSSSITTSPVTMLSSPSMSSTLGTAVHPILISSSLSTTLTKRSVASSLLTMVSTPSIPSSRSSSGVTPAISSSFGTKLSLSSIISPFGTATISASMSSAVPNFVTSSPISASPATMLMPPSISSTLGTVLSIAPIPHSLGTAVTSASISSSLRTMLSASSISSPFGRATGLASISSSLSTILRTRSMESLLVTTVSTPLISSSLSSSGATLVISSLFGTIVIPSSISSTFGTLASTAPISSSLRTATSPGSISSSLPTFTSPPSMSTSFTTMLTSPSMPTPFMTMLTSPSTSSAFETLVRPPSTSASLATMLTSPSVSSIFGTLVSTISIPSSLVTTVTPASMSLSPSTMVSTPLISSPFSTMLRKDSVSSVLATMVTTPLTSSSLPSLGGTPGILSPSGTIISPVSLSTSSPALVGSPSIFLSFDTMVSTAPISLSLSTLVSTPAISSLFSTMLRKRSMSSSFESLGTTLTTLASLGTAVSTLSAESSSTMNLTTAIINPSVSTGSSLVAIPNSSIVSSTTNFPGASTKTRATNSSVSFWTYFSVDNSTSYSLGSTISTNDKTLLSSLLTTSKVNVNTTQAIPSMDCVFPFRYLGQWYEKCISDTLNNSWCSLTVDFDRDQKWKYCQTSRIKTIGGTGNGSDCIFPFVYQRTTFSTCIYRTVVTGSTTSFSLFCSVTSNLDQDGLWGYCLDYDSCYFPFVYNGIAYSDCISGPESARWCSTTASFDHNKMWSNCPVTCDGYPQQDENTVGFQLISGQPSCIFKHSIDQETGLTLKYYALPTCQMQPLCRNNYFPLFKQITCKEDGRYDYRISICVPLG